MKISPEFSDIVNTVSNSITRTLLQMKTYQGSEQLPISCYNIARTSNQKPLAAVTLVEEMTVGANF